MTETEGSTIVAGLSPASPVRFGVLGTGRITRRLVADLQQHPAADVTAIASRDGARARWYADQFGIPHGFHGYDALLESDEVDAVYVALPPSLHAEFAVGTLRAGKHLLCEKPLVCDLEQWHGLETAASDSGLSWLDATGWVHHPRTVRMGEILQSGRLGAVRHVSSSVSFFEPFQSGDHRLDASLGGGCLLDLGWYAVGLAVWAVGGVVPERVQASGIERDGVWYRVTALMDFPGGISATAHCGYDIATRKWMEIAGEDASLICDDFTRPWQQRPPRFWVHDRAGDVVSETLEGHQESAMISAFCDEVNGLGSLESLRQQASSTQQALAAIASALESSI